MRRAGAALRQNSPPACSQAEITARSGISCWQSTASDGGSSKPPSSSFAPGRHCDRRLARGVDRDQGDAGRCLAQVEVELDARLAEPGERLLRERSRDRRLRPVARWRRGGRRRLPGWRPCRRGCASNVAPVTVSPGRGSDVAASDEVEVDRPDDGDPWGRHRRIACAQAAIARRSSTVEPSRVSRRSNRPAHNDERSRTVSSRAQAARPSSARTSTANSR